MSSAGTSEAPWTRIEEGGGGGGGTSTPVLRLCVVAMCGGYEGVPLYGISISPRISEYGSRHRRGRLVHRAQAKLASYPLLDRIFISSQCEADCRQIQLRNCRGAFPEQAGRSLCRREVSAVRKGLTLCTGSQSY